MLAYQLLRPLAYLRISDQSKWKIDWLVPSILAISTGLIFLLLPLRPSLFSQGGVLSLLSPLLAIMPGFYLAALAAIATFNKIDMDELLPDPTPKVEVMVRGRPQEIELTRRRMLALQFGYLTFVSLTLYICAIASAMVAPSVGLMVEGEVRRWAATMLVAVLAFGFWHMIAITMFGLYQLSDRMHQPDARPPA